MIAMQNMDPSEVQMEEVMQLLAKEGKRLRILPFGTSDAKSTVRKEEAKGAKPRRLKSNAVVKILKQAATNQLLQPSA